MFKFVVAACLLVTTHGAPHKNLRNIFPTGKIVGGTSTTIEKVPWQVALEDGYFLFCGGSIISKHYVLTSAYCTDGKEPAQIQVRSGSGTLESGGTVTKVSAIAQHPGFTQDNLDSDVSVLKLAKPIALSAMPAPVILSRAEASKGDTAQVTGWGTVVSGGSSLPKNLQIVSVPVVSRTDCGVDYSSSGYEITDRMVCAGQKDKDACLGDSGGALTINGKQAGIVSWGYGCAFAGYPGVYSNIIALADFINENSNNEALWA